MDKIGENDIKITNYLHENSSISCTFAKTKLKKITHESFKLMMFFVLMAVSNLTVLADDNGQKPIDVKPVVGPTAPTKPKAPSLLSISAYTDGNAVVITSTVDIMAHVKIFDSASGQTYYNNTVTIAPQCRCLIPHTDATLTLQITVGDMTYEGSFTLQ